MESLKSRKKLVIIISSIAGAVLIAAVVGILLWTNAVSKKNRETYDKAMAQYESGDYAGAFDAFESLDKFEDSRAMAKKAENQRDFLAMEEMAQQSDFKKIADMLWERSIIFAGTQDGDAAEKLAEEYESLSGAYDCMKAGDYDGAYNKFEQLDELKDDYASDVCLCRAHRCIKSKDWWDALDYLYIYGHGEYNLSVLSDPSTDEDKAFTQAVLAGDSEKAAEMISSTDANIVEMKETALKGVRYNEAKNAMNSGDFGTAMNEFEALGDFLDSRSLYLKAKDDYETYEVAYKDALELYNSKHFYKAMTAFEDLGEYKDAEKKAASCKQALPKNGALKKNAGGIKLNIQAPGGSESVLVRVYNSSDKVVGQVFIRPGKKATIKVKSGSYKIKVGYGTEWYGSDLFGPTGSYTLLKNGSSSTFSFKSGYAYTLKLMTVANGNVGSESIGSDEM